MTGGFSAVLRQYGKPAAVRRGETVRVGLAMVQPLLEKDAQWVPTPLGRQRRDRFLCLGGPELAESAPGEDELLEWDGQRYDIETAQAMTLGERTLYWWAVLTVREEDITAVP